MTTIIQMENEKGYYKVLAFLDKNTVKTNKEELAFLIHENDDIAQSIRVFLSTLDDEIKMDITYD
jgi:hypothetical protein